MSEQRINKNTGETPKNNIKDGISDKETEREWKKTVLKNSIKFLSTRENGYWKATEMRII
jgi:hypothetical protein